MNSFIIENWYVFFLLSCILYFVWANVIKTPIKRIQGSLEIKASNDYLSNDIQSEIKPEQGLANTSVSRVETEPAKKLNFEKPTRVLWMNLTSEDNTDTQQLLFDKYFNTINECVDKTEKSLIILDLVDHAESMKVEEYKTTTLATKNILQDCYNRYFEKIEHFLQNNPKVVYTRIIMLPAFSNTYREIYNVKKAPFEIVNLGMLLYEPAIRHIERVYKAISEKKINENNFEIYFLENPIRAFSEIIIDSKYWINEIDIHDKKGISRPDRLFINEGTDDSAMSYLIQKERELIEKIIKSGGARKLDSLAFKQILEKSENYI